MWMEQYVRKLYEVERYHRKLAKILDGQFSVEKEQVQGEIVALQEQLQAVRGQIRELGFVGSVSKEFLDRHSELKGRIDALKLQNEAYLTLLDLQDARKKADNMLKSAITSILVDIALTVLTATGVLILPVSSQFAKTDTCLISPGEGGFIAEIQTAKGE